MLVCMYTAKQLRAEEMLRRARSRAKKHNLPFNIDISDIETPDLCPVLDIPLDYSDWRSRRYSGKKADSPCLDRKEPALGYIKGNVWTISSRANSRKYTTPLSSFSSFEAFREYIARLDRGFKDKGWNRW